MESLHYLLMADHFMLQKALIASLQGTGMTPGQPKVLDYLAAHEGSTQKEIAAGCHIEPATLTRILTGMENQDYIERRYYKDDRRSIHIFMTDHGREMNRLLAGSFSKVEGKALEGFSENEIENLLGYLTRVYRNMEPAPKR